jgi:hypothetical protein
MQPMRQRDQHGKKKYSFACDVKGGQGWGEPMEATRGRSRRVPWVDNRNQSQNILITYINPAFTPLFLLPFILNIAQPSTYSNISTQNTKKLSTMCGIFACHNHPNVQKFKPTALKLGKAYVRPLDLGSIH